MKKAFLALSIVFVAGSAAQAFPFWHHRHHRHHRVYHGSTSSISSQSNPGGIYNGQ